MGRIWMPGGGGGADLDVVTASASNILTGKVIVDKDGNPLTGTMPDNTGTALTVATNGKTLIPKGYFDGTTYVTNTQATMAGGTKTPTTSAQTIACNGKLMTSNIVIPAFSLPAASSIKKGVTVTIYGKSVVGTWEGYVTSPLYLFKNGAWSNLQTTGFNNGASSDTLMGSSYLCIDDLCHLNQAVNLTSYNYVKIVCATYSHIMTGGAYLGVSTSSSLTDLTKCAKYVAVDISSSKTDTTIILDVSSLTGNYYIYLCDGYYTSSGSKYAQDIYLKQLFLSTT